MGLSVFIDPIELEDIFLGDFQIQLQISQLSAMKNNNFLKIIALDAHPAACNDAVTHPHVSDEFLCTGDATVSIQNSLVIRICRMFVDFSSRGRFSGRGFFPSASDSSTL